MRAALEAFEGKGGCCPKECSAALLENWDATAEIVRSAALRSQDEIRTLVSNLGSLTLKKFNTRRASFTYLLPTFGPVCRDVFATALLLPPMSLARLVSRSIGPTGSGSLFKPFSHGLSDKISNRALLETTKAAFVEFVLKLVEETAEMDPARRSRNTVAANGNVVCYLPPIFSHKAIHARFDEWIKKERFEVYQNEVKRRKSADVIDRSRDWTEWPPVCAAPSTAKIFEEQKALAHVKIRNARSDVCDDCSSFASQIHATSGHPSVTAMLKGTTFEDPMANWTAHVDAAKRARAVYTREVQEAKDTCPVECDGTPIPGRKWEDWKMHLSFDFAQQIEHIKMFGIVNDGLDLQTNYCMVEGDAPTGTGSNVVASLLDTYLGQLKDKFGAENVGQIKHLRLHADNCIGQSKSNTVLWLMLWLVCGDGRHVSSAFETITLKFVVKGHTKVSVDRGFGLISFARKGRTISTVEDVVAMINESVACNEAHLVQGGDIKDFCTALAPYFKAFEGLADHDEFRVSRAHTGVVDARREDGEDWLRTSLWADDVAAGNVRDALFPEAGSGGTRTSSMREAPEDELVRKKQRR